MNREILLIEPNYKNKYPPMGIMKISTYYKKMGDHVTFFKGDLNELVLRDTFERLTKQLYANDDSICWEKYHEPICLYLKKGSVKYLAEVPGFQNNTLIKELFKYYRKYFFHKYYFKPEFRKYDKVGITTLFTFYWDITIKTINFAKQLCKSPDGVMVGGVMASILADRVEVATGIKPHVGTLHTPGELDAGNDLIIDSLPLDYSILEEIDYKYPAADAYFAYMTRGCINKCAFCAVPKLEPQYENYLPVSKQVKLAEKKYGQKRNLLLLDNNVLASKKFNEIIDDIKNAGFYKGATYISPNQYEIAIQNLHSGQNDHGYIKSCVKQFKTLLKKEKSKDIQKIYNLLCEHQLLDEYTATKENIFLTYKVLKPYFEKMYKNKPKKRYVDFNQGIDSRLVKDENMKKMAEIPVRPVRIAFDHWELHDVYERAIRTAARHGHIDLSNYILYNFKDKPIELYWRLKMNIDLCEELNVTIYSFPMKYHPIEDPKYFSNRDYIGKYWNRKFIRTIQAILNSTKGKVGRGKEFFYKAFGKNEDEFYELLYMPEVMIIYRLYFENIGLTARWRHDFNELTELEKKEIKPIIKKNVFTDIETMSDNKNVLNVLKYYQITRKSAQEEIKAALN